MFDKYSIYIAAHAAHPVNKVWLDDHFDIR